MKLPPSTRGHKSIGEVVEEHTIDCPPQTLRSRRRCLSCCGPVGAIRRATEVVGTNGPTYPLDAVRLLAGGGADKRDITNELSQAYRGGRASQVKEPDTQVRFIKQVYVWLDRMTRCPCVSFNNARHKVELAVPIGRKCRHVSREQARSVIAGYSVCNDIPI